MNLRWLHYESQMPALRILSGCVLRDLLKLGKSLCDLGCTALLSQDSSKFHNS